MQKITHCLWVSIVKAWCYASDCASNIEIHNVAMGAVLSFSSAFKKCTIWRQKKEKTLTTLIIYLRVHPDNSYVTTIASAITVFLWNQSIRGCEIHMWLLARALVQLGNRRLRNPLVWAWLWLPWSHLPATFHGNIFSRVVAGGFQIHVQLIN